MLDKSTNHLNLLNSGHQYACKGLHVTGNNLALSAFILMEAIASLCFFLLTTLGLAIPSKSQTQWEATDFENNNLPGIKTQEWKKVFIEPETSNGSQIIWEPVPETINTPNSITWEPIPEETLNPVESNSSVNIRQSSVSQPSRPSLHSLNRSIAYSDGYVGPDIGWNVPNGLRWSQRWFADVSLAGFSRRPKDSNFFAWNNGDAVAQASFNLIQSGSWSIGINTSFRSVYQGSQASGGTTQVGEGFSSGFRIAKEIGKTGGIAFGGEQIIQFDSDTDTGRNFYLMATKGWWLGNDGNEFPLLIANGGFGTGRFANQDILSWKNPLRFACINNVDNRTNTFSVDNDLCWSPIGTIALVLNDYWSIFLEYRSGTAQALTSLSLSEAIPVRLTWGVDFASKNELKDSSEWNWVFRASVGF